MERTIGIVVFGGNGRRIAEVLAPMNTRILATDVFPDRKPAHVDELWSADRLDELLPLVDTLILCVPLNAQTTGMIGSHELSKMKSGALLINVARGPVVAESALVDALQSGQISGARARRDRSRTTSRNKRAMGFTQRDYHATRREPNRPV